jgi:RNA recognition motif-containing protein
MQNKLFVGSLPFSIDDQALGELFAPYGEVKSANVAMDRNTGQSRGFGFVEMGTNEEAKAALNALNGHDVSGRQLYVDIAKPMAERPNNNHRSGGPRPQRSRY